MSPGRRLSVMAGLIVFLLTGCPAPGQRYLEARIEKDGQAVLRTHFAVPDSWDKHAAWKRLEGQAFKNVDDFKPAPAADGQLVLKGKIKLLLLHTKTPFAVAEVDTLGLSPDPAGKGAWQIPPEEVKRTGLALQ